MQMACELEQFRADTGFLLLYFIDGGLVLGADEKEKSGPRKFFSVKVADDFFLKVFGFVFRFVFC
jgi:hypothetical protein